DGGEIEPPEDRSREGTRNRQGEPVPVRPGITQRPNEVSHASTSTCKSGWVMAANSRVERGCNRIGGREQAGLALQGIPVTSGRLGIWADRASLSMERG